MHLLELGAAGEGGVIRRCTDTQDWIRLGCTIE